MRKRPYALSLVAALLLAGCQTSTTPQASEEAKKQLLGRKPTAEEISKAMGDANARLNQKRDSAGK